MLENDIIPLYYTKPNDWLSVMKQSMKDVVPLFDSNRMAHEYYDKMYSLAGALSTVKDKSKKVEAI
jgi:glycogen phosphorylase